MSTLSAFMDAYHQLTKDARDQTSPNGGNFRLVQHRKALADVVRDPTVTHLLREDLDVETLLDSIVGAYLAERGRSGAVAPEWADRVLATLWPAVAPASS